MSASAQSAPPARVAVITVSYGSDAVLPGFLRTVSSGSPLEIVIADNRPGFGGTAEIARSASARYLALDNPGYGGAVNAAAAGLPTAIEWLLISNPDVLLGEGALDELIRIGDSEERVGSVGPLIRSDTGAVYPSARSVPSLRTGVGHALLANIWPANPWTRAYRNEVEVPENIRDAGWLSGSCLLVRRAVFDEIGGFDTGYFMYFEDVDLGYRIERAGFRNIYDPRAEVVHSGAHSTTGESERMLQAHHASARRFIERKYSHPFLLPIRIAARVGLALRLRLVRRKALASLARGERPRQG